MDSKPPDTAPYSTQQYGSMQVDQGHPAPAGAAPPDTAFAAYAQAAGVVPPSRWQRCDQWKHKYLRPQLDTHLDVSFVLLTILLYGVLYFSMGSPFLPGHAVWCTLLMWACSLVAAALAHQLYLPRVIGMLAAGILLQNIPWTAIDAFPPKWGAQMRAGALATIFLRCGLELDVGTMRKYKYPAMRLALLPGLAEALFDAGLGVALFKMDYLLGLTMGFILKAVGPGLVVPAMFRLQKAGLGTENGIPATVVISASFDDCVAITGYAIFSTLAIQQEGAGGTGGVGDAGWSIASGPTQVVFGVLGGILLGCVVGATRLWNSRLKRFIAIYGSCLFLMFLLEHWHLLSGGALGALFTGLVASNAWEKGIPRFASVGPSLQYSPEIERWMGKIWCWVAEPILFVTVGSTLDFSTLSSGTVPKSIIIVVAGVTVRVVCTYVAMSDRRYNWKEKLFYAIAWTPKATVQAALSAAPLTLIKELKDPSAPDYAEWVAWGNDILTTGLFAIIICGTLGVMAIHYSAPLLLQQATEEGKEGASSEGTPDAAGGLEPGGGAAGGGDGGAAPGAPPPKRAASAGPPFRPVSPALGSIIVGEDAALVAEYINAINVLTTTLTDGKANRQEVLQRVGQVSDMQRRIEIDLGHREPSVRELFRAASAIADGRSTAMRRGASSRSVAALDKAQNAV